jgi:hypothetical protein
MAHTLAFVPWTRSGMYDVATRASSGGGRLRGEVVLTATVRGTATTRQGTAAFEIAGPGDVQGLSASAVRRMMPPPLTTDAETPLMPHVELADLDLPWRFTPQVASGRVLRPWIVLVIGAESEIQLVSQAEAVLTQPVLAAHDLARSARWAHVQIDLVQGIEDADLAALTVDELKQRIAQDGGTAVARLVSPRQMAPNTAYIAAIVPAFNANGTNRWQTSDAQVQLPVYHSWTFRTGEAGDFRTICAQLRAERNVGTLGGADLSIQYVAPPVATRIRGAITAVGGADAALPQLVTNATAALQMPGVDPRGRPIVGLPLYGSPWKSNPQATTWGLSANSDPRHRAAGGLGLAAGIALQDDIVDAVVEQIGAAEIVNQRLSYLASGVAASASLWTRRLPANADGQIALFWSAAGRMVTNQGTVLDRITAADRPLPRALFSSAGRRILRRGPARTRFARPGAADPSAVVRAANRCPPPPGRTAPGLLHADNLAAKLHLSDPRSLLEPGKLKAENLLGALTTASQRVTQPALRDQLDKLIARLTRDLNQNRHLPIPSLLELLRLLDDWDKHRDEIKRLAAQMTDQNEPAYTPDLGEAVAAIRTRPPTRLCRPVDLDQLAVDLRAAIDPTRPDAWIKVRVLATIQGLPDNSTQPSEACTSVNLPAWRFLRDVAPDLLLPGVDQLVRDRVYAFESNPAFVDGFLLGLNHQTLAELRWRNLRIASACTPLRIFWGRIAGGGGDPLDDIRSVSLWPDASPLGGAQHRPAQVAPQNLILVFRTDLFRRYPDTIVSAIRAGLDGNGEPDFNEAAAPDGSEAREWPVFQGSIGEDVTFFGFPFTPSDAQAMWFLLEEPPPGYRFRSDVPGDAPNGADFARVRFNDPARVLIRGGEIL